MSDDEAALRRLLAKARTKSPMREPYQLRRAEYLLDSGRYDELFAEGLFQWLQTASTATPANQQTQRRTA